MGDYANYARDLFKVIGFIYIALTLAALVAALWLPKKAWGKALAASFVIGMASILPMKSIEQNRINEAKAAEYKARYAKAKALFDERCKTAGEKIYRTVEGVEGVLLMNLPTKSVNLSDQYTKEDVYMREFTAEGYIQSFLRITSGGELNPKYVAQHWSTGYKWVEAKDPIDQKMYRYSGGLSGKRVGSTDFELTKTNVSATSAKYAVAFSDISSKEDRDHWIAGSSLKILDIKTNEVIAVRIGYMFDHALGNKGVGRSPWDATQSCNNVERKYGHGTRSTFRLLKPLQGE